MAKREPSLKKALEELEAIAQEALNNIDDAAAKYADSKLPYSSYCKEWQDLADAFKAGVRWVANKHNITF